MHNGLESQCIYWCFSSYGSKVTFWLKSLSAEDTVVAVSVTGILKVWIITAEVNRMQVVVVVHSERGNPFFFFDRQKHYWKKKIPSGPGPGVRRRIQTHILSGLSEYFLLYVHSEQPAGGLLQVLEGKRWPPNQVLITHSTQMSGEQSNTWPQIKSQICLCLSGFWCRWLFAALLRAQWQWQGLGWRRVHCSRQSHHLDWRRL